MSSRFKHVIWDWNGTLIDDAWLCIDVINSLLMQRGRAPISKTDYKKNFGFPVINFYNYLGFETDLDSFKSISREFISAYESRWLNECVLHPKVTDVLNTLSERGLTHSVLSAAEQKTLELGIEHYGLKDFFLGLIGIDNIYAEGKIARGCFWVEQLENKRDEIIMIGDTLHDYEVAETMGISCVLLAHGHHDHQRLSTTGAPVVDDMEGLIDYLKLN